MHKGLEELACKLQDGGMSTAGGLPSLPTIKRITGELTLKQKFLSIFFFFIVFVVCKGIKNKCSDLSVTSFPWETISLQTLLWPEHTYWRHLKQSSLLGYKGFTRSQLGQCSRHSPSQFKVTIFSGWNNSKLTKLSTPSCDRRLIRSL